MSGLATPVGTTDPAGGTPETPIDQPFPTSCAHAARSHIHGNADTIDDSRHGASFIRHTGSRRKVVAREHGGYGHSGGRGERYTRGTYITRRIVGGAANRSYSIRHRPECHGAVGRNAIDPGSFNRGAGCCGRDAPGRCHRRRGHDRSSGTAAGTPTAGEQQSAIDPDRYTQQPGRACDREPEAAPCQRPSAD